MKKLSPRETEVYKYIQETLDDMSLAPSLQEIADTFGFSLTRAKMIIDKMILKGHLERSEGKARSIRIKHNLGDV